VSAVSRSGSDDERARLRRDLRARRRALPPEVRDAAARALARRVAGQPVYVRARRVATYLANDGEMDPAYLVRRAWASGRRVYLPVLIDRPWPLLRFAPFTPDTTFTRNRFGIPEPDVPRRKLLPARALDLLLLPLVAFDAAGNRLGMGGGYFDRTLAYQRGRRWRRPRLLGIGYAFQQVDGLAAAAWDVPLHGVVTERGAHVAAPAQAQECER
jgi:5-formyltetrahydrofolate cyclo-ligase